MSENGGEVLSAKSIASRRYIPGYVLANSKFSL
jgi:hypothetical protein